VDRVLFVDDDANVLHGLKVMLHTMRNQWQMGFAQGGAEALALMEQDGPFHVVVSDIHMPGMHGAEFLTKVMEQYPQTVRFVLSGNLDNKALIESSSVAHQVLSKPCDPNLLRSLLVRALSLRDRLTESPLKATLLDMGALPSVPVIYWEIMNEINSPEPSIERVGMIIEKDPGMSAKVLQIVNVHSGQTRRISNIREAARLLGLENIKSFVLMVEIYSQYEAPESLEGFHLESLWHHGLMVGKCAKIIVESESGDRKVMDDSYTSGLLHDIGILMMASKLPEEFQNAVRYAREKRVTLEEAEKKLLRATHGELGGYLLDLWGISEHIVDAITNHYMPSASPDIGYSSFDGDWADKMARITPLTAVHVANYFCQDGDGDECEAGRARSEIDMYYLDRIGMSDRVEKWWNLCAQEVQKGHNFRRQPQH
jgi:HD-like signal output (HDOD) protein